MKITITKILPVSGDTFTLGPLPGIFNRTVTLTWKNKAKPGTHEIQLAHSALEASRNFCKAINGAAGIKFAKPVRGGVQIICPETKSDGAIFLGLSNSGFRAVS